MNISYKWLKEYVDFDMTAEEVAAALTSIGLEVEDTYEVQSIRGGLKGLVVGHVLTCIPHPNSDHMHICSVDLGQGEPIQIVCGAQNIAADQKVIVATIGTVLYDGDKEFVIKKSKLRGEESFGMICAEDEIGVGTSHAGIIELPADTPVGMPAAEYYQLESDYVIEVDITPNRSDGASHYGVARDLYAYLRRHGIPTALHRPSVEAFQVDNHDLDFDIEIENAEACPHYCAISVKGCEVKESPQWLKNKLQTIGLHSINNIVDITNYVMMAFGQPLHCFDADKVKGKKIVVRTLPEGTPFVTLDGETHELSERDLAICNAEAPMCIAGVLGGQGSGTYETTKDILFESAYFNPTWVRKSARRHGLNTDASFRFERGIDPNGQIYALKIAAILAKELAGGTISMELKEVVAREVPQHFDVRLDYAYLDRIVGKQLDRTLVKDILTSLEMRIAQEDEQGLQLEVPAYRVDVKRPCDVVEDLLRIYGYNNVEIPTTISICQVTEGEEDRSYKKQQLIAGQLEGQGFYEIMNNSLSKAAYYEGSETFAPEHLVRLLNPLSSDLGVLRQSLLFGGLESISRNVRRKATNLKFFEMGNVYHFDETKRKNRTTDSTNLLDQQRCEQSNHMAAYSEEFHLALWVTGKRHATTWNQKETPTTVFDLKAYVEQILLRLGVPTAGLVMKENVSDIFAKSIAATDRNGKVIYEWGIVSPKITKLFDLSQEVYFADFNWRELMRLTAKEKVEFESLSKFPTVSRDLALLVDEQVTFAEIEQIARKAEKKCLKTVTLFDVYKGKELEAGKKSYAVNFTLEDKEKTMTDKQLDGIMKKIAGALQHQLNAKLR